MKEQNYEFESWLSLRQKEKLEKWCSKNCSGKFIIHHVGSLLNNKGSNYKLCFEEETDLVAVKLRWFK